MKPDKLLKELVDYCLLPDEAENDIVDYAENLIAKINKAGFRYTTEMNEKRAKMLKDSINLSFCFMSDEPTNYGKVESIVTSPLEVRTILSKSAPDKHFDLGDSGDDGIMFVIKILMFSQGLTMVKRCEECGCFFSPNRKIESGATLHGNAKTP